MADGTDYLLHQYYGKPDKLKCPFCKRKLKPMWQRYGTDEWIMPTHYTDDTRATACLGSDKTIHEAIHAQMENRK